MTRETGAAFFPFGVLCNGNLGQSGSRLPLNERFRSRVTESWVIVLFSRFLQAEQLRRGFNSGEP